MPITWLLGRDHHAFAPDQIKVLTEAFEDALRTLGLVDHSDPVATIVAKRIIQLARLGETDPIRLRDYAVEMDQAQSVKSSSSGESDLRFDCNVGNSKWRIS